MSDVQPRVSVVIPTFNRPEHVLDTVRRLHPQLRRFGAECIVVDQSEAPLDATVRDGLAELPGARYVRVETPSLPNARNVGAARARGNVVLFLDDDVVPGEGLLEAHLACYASPGVGGVAGRIIEAHAGRNRNTARIGTRVNWVGRVYRNYDGQEPMPVDAPPGGNMSFSRDALLAVGGFDSEYVGTAALEETDFGFRVRAHGFRILFAPEAVLVHLAAPAGGCRVTDPVEREMSNFRNLTRFFFKHKTRMVFPAFVLVNALVFLKRMHGVVPLRVAVARYAQAIASGVASLRQEPA